MRLVILLWWAALLLSGCGKAHSVCWTQGDGSSAHAEFGYFYDSAAVTLSGPTQFKRVHKDQVGDPCGLAGPPSP